MTADSSTNVLNYNSPAGLRAFLDANGLGMRKKYGQNFLINPRTRQALVEALGAGAGETVWEIGPGLGAMTRLLLDRGLVVDAFDIDPGFAAALRGFFASDSGFTLIEGDVMKTWQRQAVAEAPYLLGNLPYNIAAALLADFIEKGRRFRRMVVTVQREVALRMAARPGSADYSSFSVLCALAYTVKPLMVIQGASFYPRPRVDSQGVLLDARPDTASGSLPPVFYSLLRCLFTSRRKMIKNNLTNFIAARTGIEKPPLAAAALLEKAGLTGGERAENLEPEAFAALAKDIEDMRILQQECQ
ncbi:MAG: 16S rRNA (adenine(1518)-N(6)/adenine(1519)-N(6))-dimethyltransferase RsmA [Treponema sp.]|nr:16S rRNA (adenine(1518)-N(6)/adenine(1519)-N(6))-dimethyltransferase RsmA [Treponema sp.]